jgi:chromosomal replication initiation ATPase DnaA
MTGLKIADVRREVGLYFNLSKPDLLKPTYARRFARPRQIAMTLSREFTGASYPKIARAFGRYHHTTVLHARRNVALLEATKPEVKEAVEALRARLTELIALRAQRARLVSIIAQRAAALEGAL